LLAEGRVPVIAIRETRISKYNPWTYGERVETFRRMMGKSYNECLFLKVPDIDDVVHGRTPGWNIREINLEEDMQQISATDERAQIMGMILWLTGNSGSGKTSLANELQQRIENSIVLDGDEMRNSISLGAGFGMDDRKAHNETVARLAVILAQRGHTLIVSVISPTHEIRAAVQRICNPLWVYVYKTLQPDKDRPYEAPVHADIIVDHDLMSVEQSADRVIEAVWDA